MYGNINIKLFSKLHQDAQTVDARSTLRENGYTFTEASRKEIISFLHKRMGKPTRLPGILVDGTTWIPTRLDRPWLNDLEEAVVNKLLNQGNTILEPLEEEEEAEDQIEYQGQRLLPLPNGSLISIVELTKRLLEYHKSDSLTFTGKRAMVVFKRHLGIQGVQAAMDFGNFLIDQGILVVVKKDWTSFEDSIVQLQATRGLNSFLPAERDPSEQSWTDVVSTLSICMDNIICTSDHGKRRALIEKLNTDSSTLQTTPFCLEESTDDDEESLLQLYNLIVRHFSLEHKLPTTLPGFLSAQDEYGYILQGTFVRAADLRSWLWTRSLSTRLPTIVNANKCRQQGSPWLFRRVIRNKDRAAEDWSFAAKVVTAATDVQGLLLGMVWTTATSAPCAVTLSPEAAARLVCKSQVVLDGSSLWVPLVVNWFRKDFGESTVDVLNSLAPYSDVVRTVLAKRQRVDLQFGSPPPEVAKGSLGASVGIDEESFFDQSVYIERVRCGTVPQQREDNFVHPARHYQIAAVEEETDEGESFLPSLMTGGRQPSQGDFRVSVLREGHPEKPAAICKQCIVKLEDGDQTETTFAEESITNDDDYADWYNSDTISALTFESSRDLLVNEAYMSGGNVSPPVDSLSMKYSI